MGFCLIDANVTLAAPTDVLSTRSFVNSYAGMLRTRTALLPHSSIAAGSWTGAVARGCRDVLSGAPMSGGQGRAILREVDGSVAVAFNAPARPAMARFVARTGHLRWSRRAVAREVGAFAGAVDALARIRVPHLCSDLRTWAHGGFHSLPAGTMRFDTLLSSITRQQKHAIPSGALRPYLVRSSAAAATRADALARRYALLAGVRAQQPITRLRRLLGAR